MFRYKKLIFAILLTGCTTQAADTPVNLLKETAEEPIEESVDEFVGMTFSPNNDLLESVESTLGVADEAIEEIIANKVSARKTISNLQTTVSHEEDLLAGLGSTVAAKDSLIFTYEETNILLQSKIADVENTLNHALHKCTTECYPTITRLKQENEELLNYTDSLQNWVFYLDSLVSTNKKLSKKLTQHEIR